MLGRDAIAGLICLAGSLWLLALTRGLPRPALLPLGPAFYPRAVLVITAALSAILVVADWLSRRRSRGEVGPGVSPRAPAGVGTVLNYRLVLVTFVVFAAYVFLLPGLGYRLATFLFVVALQGVLEPPRGRRWLSVLAVAAVTALATYLVFERYLYVLLPRGSWTGF